MRTHGTRSCYNHGCRCDACRAVAVAYARSRRHAPGCDCAKCDDLRAKKRKYRAENREAELLRKRLWYAKNRDRINAEAREKHAANPGIKHEAYRRYVEKYGRDHIYGLRQEWFSRQHPDTSRMYGRSSYERLAADELRYARAMSRQRNWERAQADARDIATLEMMRGGGSPDG